MQFLIANIPILQNVKTLRPPHGPKEAHVVHRLGPDQFRDVPHPLQPKFDPARPPREGFRSISPKALEEIADKNCVVIFIVIGKAIVKLNCDHCAFRSSISWEDLLMMTDSHVEISALSHRMVGPTNQPLSPSVPFQVSLLLSRSRFAGAESASSVTDKGLRMCCQIGRGPFELCLFKYTGV